MSRKNEMIFTSAQCRAARELLKWKQQDLAKIVQVTEATIGRFERDLTSPALRTIRDIKFAFEEAGIIFLNDEEGVGVKLKSKATNP